MRFGNNHLFALKSSFVLEFQNISRAVHACEHPVPQVFELAIDRGVNHLIYLLKTRYIGSTFTPTKRIIGGYFTHQYIYIRRMQQVIGCNQRIFVIFFRIEVTFRIYLVLFGFIEKIIGTSKGKSEEH